MQCKFKYVVVLSLFNMFSFFISLIWRQLSARVVWFPAGRGAALVSPPGPSRRSLLVTEWLKLMDKGKFWPTRTNFLVWIEWQAYPLSCRWADRNRSGKKPKQSVQRHLGDKVFFSSTKDVIHKLSAVYVRGFIQGVDDVTFDLSYVGVGEEDPERRPIATPSVWRYILPSVCGIAVIQTIRHRLTDIGNE